MRHVRTGLALLVLVASVDLAAQVEPLPAPAAGPDRIAVDRAIADLRAADPNARIDADGFGRIHCTGSALARGADADAAVDAWFAAHAAVLGAGAADFELLSVTPLSDRRLIAYAYRLWSGEIPIEGGIARLLARDDGETGARLVYAAAHAARVPAGGWPAVQVPAAAALATARAALPAPGLRFSDPELVIEPSATRRAPSRLVWHIEAHRADAGGHEAWTVVVDPVGGAVLDIRDELISVDVTGTVQAWVNPPNEPNTAANPPTLIPLEGTRVRIIGGATANAAANGTFTIEHPGTAPVTVEAALVGPWSEIFDQAGPQELLTTVTTPPGPVAFTFDAAGDSLVQAQLNGFHFVTRTHDFVRDRTTGIAGIDVSIPTNVNISDVCNAFFDPFANTVNFFLAGGGCVNSAYSSVVSHEYGHFVVDQLGVAQGAFGEGFGDVLSMFMYDDPIIGRDFSGPGTVVRDPVAANVQYPCSGGVHFCGQLLGGVWWNIRVEVGGLAAAQQLYVDWSLITTGGQGDSSAHPGTAIEVLTADDDDGDLGNGSPRFTEICDAFAGHSISCPVLPPVLITFPAGRPDSVQPQTPTGLLVDIAPGTATPIAATAELHVRGPGEAVFSVVPLAALGGISYSATIPGQDCGGAVEYFVEVNHSGGGIVRAPSAGAADPFIAPIYDFLEVAFADDLESDLGWSAGIPGDTATVGFWTRVAPVGTAAAPSSDHSDPGALCFVTGQGVPGGGLGAQDVDGGTTTLLSPVFDLSAPGDYAISYWRWFSNDSGSQPNTEVFTVSISANGGQSWTTVEVVGPTGAEASGGWFRHEFDVASIIAPTASMRLRFLAADPDPGSLVEAAVDDIEIVRRICDPSPQFRRGDINGDQAIDITDPVALLMGLFSGVLLDCFDAGDIDDAGDLTILDPILILDHLFATGAPIPAPFPSCGSDPTADGLDCAVEPVCP